MPEGENAAAFARTGALLAFFLSTGKIDVLMQDLMREGGLAPDTPAAVVYKATWPDERVYRCTVGTLAKTVADNGLTKTALIIVGGCLGTEYLRSKLYDPGFTTEFRKGSGS